MTWPPPELETGEEPELRPPEFELDEFEVEEPELAEFELEEFELEELELAEFEPELAEVEADPLEEDALAVCVDPGRTRASAPAVTTLAMATVVVVDRTLLRPCSLAAMARRMPSRCALLMYPILRPRTRKSLHESSAEAMNRAAPSVVGEPRGSSLSRAEATQAT